VLYVDGVDADDLIRVWIQVVGALAVIGWLLWAVGVFQGWRLQRRFKEKTGTEMYPTSEMVDRYLAQPWRWPIEAPGLTWRWMKISTTAIADEELEGMRRAQRRWLTIGGLLFVAAVALFLVPVAAGLLLRG